jgi:Uncharacterized protein containing LysM domain
MALKDKYEKLIQYAEASEVKDLSVSEQNNVLYVSGAAPLSVKDKMWELYNMIDPDMRSGDLVLSIEEIPGEEVIYEIKPGDNLSKIAKKFPDMTWKKIYEANKDIIKDPNIIYPGQKIKIPT